MKSVRLGPGNNCSLCPGLQLAFCIAPDIEGSHSWFCRAGLYFLQYERKNSNKNGLQCLFRGVAHMLKSTAEELPLWLCWWRQLQSRCFSLVSILVNFVGLPAVSMLTPLLLLGTWKLLMPSISLTVVTWQFCHLYWSVLYKIALNSEYNVDVLQMIPHKKKNVYTQ